MRERVVRRLYAFLAVSAAALAGAAAADATMVSVSLESPSRGTLIYQAADGETNHVTVEMTSDLAAWQVTETGAPLVAGPGARASMRNVFPAQPPNPTRSLRCIASIWPWATWTIGPPAEGPASTASALCTGSMLSVRPRSTAGPATTR